MLSLVGIGFLLLIHRQCLTNYVRSHVYAIHFVIKSDFVPLVWRQDLIRIQKVLSGGGLVKKCVQTINAKKNKNEQMARINLFYLFCTSSSSFLLDLICKSRVMIWNLAPLQNSALCGTCTLQSECKYDEWFKWNDLLTKMKRREREREKRSSVIVNAQIVLENMRHAHKGSLPSCLMPHKIMQNSPLDLWKIKHAPLKRNGVTLKRKRKTENHHKSDSNRFLA